MAYSLKNFSRWYFQRPELFHFYRNNTSLFSSIWRSDHFLSWSLKQFFQRYRIFSVRRVYVCIYISVRFYKIIFLCFLSAYRIYQVNTSIYTDSSSYFWDFHLFLSKDNEYLFLRASMIIVCSRFFGAAQSMPSSFLIRLSSLSIDHFPVQFL